MGWFKSRKPKEHSIVEKIAYGPTGILSIRWRKSDDVNDGVAEFVNLEPWSYTIQLLGWGENSVPKFMDRLFKELNASPLLRSTGAVEEILRSMNSKNFHRDNRVFVFPNDSNAEYSDSWKTAYRGIDGPNGLKAVLTSSRLLDKLLEFSYESTRQGQREVHRRRVKVVSVGDSYFRGRHERGVRTYSYEHMSDISQQHENWLLEPVKCIRITHAPTGSVYGGSILRLTYGILGDEGEFLDSEEVLDWD